MEQEPATLQIGHTAENSYTTISPNYFPLFHNNPKTPIHQTNQLVQFTKSIKNLSKKFHISLKYIKYTFHNITNILPYIHQTLKKVSRTHHFTPFHQIYTHENSHTVTF